MRGWRAKNPDKCKANNISNYYRNKPKYLAQKKEYYKRRQALKTPISKHQFLNYSEGIDERDITSTILTDLERLRIKELDVDTLPHHKKQCTMCQREFMDKFNKVCYWCR